MSEHIKTLSAEAYFAADGISNSMLKYISDPYFPCHYRARFITRELVDEDTPAKRLGSLTHQLILQPDTMGGAFHVKPQDMSFATKEGKAWRAEHQDRPILTNDEATTARKMRDAVWSHSGARAMLTGASTEASIFVKDKQGMLRKARIDALKEAGNYVCDLKTVENIDERSLSKSILNYRWFVQCPYYLDILELAGITKEVFAFIFVEKNPPYTVTVRPLSEADVEFGRRIYKSDLARLADCLEKNHWPGDPLDGQDICIPDFAHKQAQKI